MPTVACSPRFSFCRTYSGYRYGRASAPLKLLRVTADLAKPGLAREKVVAAVLFADQARNYWTRSMSEPRGIHYRAFCPRYGLHLCPRDSTDHNACRTILRMASSAWLRLHEKGGKRHQIPCRHNLTGYLDAWIEAAKIADDNKGALFVQFGKATDLPKIHGTGGCLGDD